MASQKLEYYPYTCPHCHVVRNAVDVAKELPREVLLPQTTPLISAMRRKRRAGPGRPSVLSCPGCSKEFSAAELRDHRIPCIRGKLQELKGAPFQLFPKDADPYPTFRLHHLANDATEVEFHKGSNGDVVTIDLRKIAEISVSNQGEKIVHVRVLGRVVWLDDIERWRFAPTAAVGRPAKLGGSL